jgi:hypothetical protein
MAKRFVRFDEIEDVLSSLDLLALVVPLLKREPSYWKWVIIAAHEGLQGAMVCSICDTSGISVLDEQSAKAMQKYFETKEGGHPKERLADFMTLLSRSQKADLMDNHPLKLSHTQADDIQLLHKHFRNNFAHFVPKGWSIEKAGLPRLVRTALDAIEILMAHQRVLYKLTGNKKRRLALRYKAIRTQL